MSATTKQDLLNHAGHSLSIYIYGEQDDPSSVTIECDECNTVLMSIDKNPCNTRMKDVMIDKMNAEKGDRKGNGDC
jgi:hypothetical protein